MDADAKSYGMKRGRAHRIAVRDIFVTIAIGLVAMALGVALFVHFEAEFPYALLLATIAYIGLLTVHMTTNRAQRRVRELEAEVDRLSGAMDRPIPAGLADAFDPPHHAEPLPAPPPVVPSFTHLPPEPPAADHPNFAPSFDLPPPAPMVERHGQAAPRFPAEFDARPDRRPLDGSVDEAIPVGPSGSIDGPPHRLDHESAGSEHSVPGNDIDVRRPLYEQPMAAGFDPLHAAVSPTGEEAPHMAGPAHPPAASPRRASDGEAASTTAGFETMQVLIQQLAAQLVAPNPPSIEEAEGDVGIEADPSGPRLPSMASTPPAASTVTELAIDESVAVLRAAAGSLRQAPDGEAMPPAAAHRRVVADAPTLPPPRLAMTQGVPPSPFARLALIAEALASDRVQVLLEPILDLDERRARHFEVSVRLHSQDGETIDTAAEAATTVADELIACIDATKLSRTVSVAERLRARGSDSALFSRLAGASLLDDKFRATAADTLAGDRQAPSGLVIAFAQRDVRAFTAAHWAAIETMVELGLQFSIEEVTDLDMDFEQLTDRGVSFVKLDAEIFLRGLPTPGGAIPAVDLCSYFSGLGMSLIVDRIESEAALAGVVQSGAVLGQGMYFGAPRAVAVDPSHARTAA